MAIVDKVDGSNPIQNGSIVVQSPKGAPADAGTSNYVIRGALDDTMASVPTTGTINATYEFMFTGCPPCTS